MRVCVEPCGTMQNGMSAMRFQAFMVDAHDGTVENLLNLSISVCRGLESNSDANSNGE
jgi:hypothetical protein